MRRYLILSFLVFLIAYTLFGQSTTIQNVQQEKRLALIIGNGNYIGSTLANPENDARAMADVLTKSGFEVLEFENLKQGQMKKAIDDFGMKLKNFDAGLFYYAGHGIQSKGLNYLIPVDADLQTEAQVEYDCVQADRVLALMEESGVKIKIIILDACRNNPFERSWTRSTMGKGLATMNAPSGTLIAYSTSPGSTASDGNGKNSLYTAALLDNIVIPNITILQMFQNVRALVSSKSYKQQIPWESTSLTGNFYFNSVNIQDSAEQTSIRQTQTLNLPTISTPEVIEVTTSDAKIKVTVSSDGGSPIIARGICYNMTQDPSISDTKTLDGGDIGSYICTLEKLVSGNTYHIRAYAINSEGIVYSKEVKFKTDSRRPIVETLKPTVISSISAVIGGNVIKDESTKVLKQGFCWDTLGPPTLTNNTVYEVVEQGGFESKISDLKPSTNYHIRAFCIIESDTIFGDVKIFKTLGPYQIVDIDGNIYNTTIIYGQFWLSENLRTTKLNDGTTIPNVSDMFAWRSKSPAYCWYNNDETLKTPYGALYNYQTVISGKLCPIGWHITSVAEWQEIIKKFGEKHTAGRYLKELGFDHWAKSTHGNTDILSYFSALPGGSRNSLGEYNGLGKYGYWWSTPNEKSDAYFFQMIYNSSRVNGFYYKNQPYGLSVRCKKDGGDL